MIQELTKLGLSSYEAKMLDSLFKRKQTLKELIKSSNVPAGKAYSVAKSLIEKNLIKETDSRPKILYVDDASSSIKKLIDKYETEKDSLVSSVKKQAIDFDKQIGKQSSFFEFGSEIEDNKNIQSRVFNEAKQEVLQIINIHHKPKNNRESKSSWEKEIESAIKRGVVFKAIYPLRTELPSILKKLNKNNPKQFQIKRLNLDYPRCDVIDGNKTMIKLVHEDSFSFGGIIFLEDKKFSQNLKRVFNKFWEEAK